MSNYKGIFLRSALGQGNEIPRQGSQSTSPDILLTGIAPVAAPQVIFTEGYNLEFKSPLLAQQANYIYLRGKNYSDQPIDDSGDNRPRLFWTKASLLLWPQTWTEITTGPSAEAFALKAEPGAVGVINQPYIWIPNNIANDHYCLIAVVPSPGYDNKIPDGNITDFNAWVATHGGIAWTNVEVINTKVTTISSKALNFEMGDEAAEIWFTLACTNLPLGCTVSLSAGMPGTNPVIYLAPTTVATSPKFRAGVKCWVPAGYESDIYFNLTVPSGDISRATIRVEATYAVEGANSLAVSEEFTL